MKHYKVTFNGFTKYQTKYVEAENESHAIEKVQDLYSFNLSKVKAREVYEPSTDDYYFMRGISIFLVIVIAILSAALIWSNW